MSTSSAPDWLKLQRKIYSRWVNQKLWMTRHIRVDDIVTSAMEDPTVILALVEVLSEREYKGPKIDKGKMRVQKVSAAGQILKFIYDECQVQMKIKTSAEDIIDGTEKNVLALVFQVLLKYMKIGDDESASNISAKDALLMWCQNKVSSYGIEIGQFTHFQSGVAMCALIHKHRPKLINFEGIPKEDKLACIGIAMKAAEAYFGLEQYITPAEFLKLDENGLFVYISEFYYGIAEQRKIDMAARRIAKVIKFTIACDQMKADFNKQADQFLKRLKSVEAVLENREIDNTMAGAKKKIEEFYQYKANDKNVLLGLQLNLEGLFNNLSMLLENNKRPSFVPPSGLKLEDVAKSMEHLDQVEHERNVALHAELNRQIKLVQLDEQHQSLYTKLEAWIIEKKTTLETKIVIDSVGAARFALSSLDAFFGELAGVERSSAAELLQKGEYVVSEKYERSSSIAERNKFVSDHLAILAQLSAQLKPVLEDDLARENFRERLRINTVQYKVRFQKMQVFVSEKTQYLQVKEDIHSVAEAGENIGLMEACEQDVKESEAGDLVALQKHCAEILSAKYETSYSQASCEDPEGINNCKVEIENGFASIAEGIAAKKPVLLDHLAREQFIEKIRISVVQYKQRCARMEAFTNEKLQYIAIREEISSIAQAAENLALLDACDKDVLESAENQLVSLSKHSNEICDARYQTDYSNYFYEDPNSIKESEGASVSAIQMIQNSSLEKRAYLDECMRKEEKKEELRLKFAGIADELVRLVKDSTQNIELSHFGFTLEEVEQYQETMQNADQALSSNLNDLKSNSQSVFEQMEALDCHDNAFTTHTPETLQQSASELEAAMESRRQKYQAELELQRANDALCLQFAQVAEPISKWVVEKKNEITHSKGKLKEQLAVVEKYIASSGQDGANLPTVRQLQEQIDAANISNNRHTALSAKDIDAQWSQYLLFLEKKKSMLEIEIEHEERRGITAEQFKEIEDNFAQFDKNGDKVIDPKELRTCLYSLGEELKVNEVAKIMEEYGKNGQIDFEGFKRFMVHILGDTDSREEIINGFILIARGEENIAKERMDAIMVDSDVAYILKTSTNFMKANMVDYKKWVEWIFNH